jgi:hypothetical protein
MARLKHDPETAEGPLIEDAADWSCVNRFRLSSGEWVEIAPNVAALYHPAWGSNWLMVKERSETSPDVWCWVNRRFFHIDGASWKILYPGVEVRRPNDGSFCVIEVRVSK